MSSDFANHAARGLSATSSVMVQHHVKDSRQRWLASFSAWLRTSQCSRCKCFLLSLLAPPLPSFGTVAINDSCHHRLRILSPELSLDLPGQMVELLELWASCVFEQVSAFPASSTTCHHSTTCTDPDPCSWHQVSGACGCLHLFFAAQRPVLTSQSGLAAQLLSPQPAHDGIISSSTSAKHACPDSDMDLSLPGCGVLQRRHALPPPIRPLSALFYRLAANMQRSAAAIYRTRQPSLTRMHEPNAVSFVCFCSGRRCETTPGTAVTCAGPCRALRGGMS